jgi:uncharacterized protein YcfL
MNKNFFLKMFRNFALFCILIVGCTTQSLPPPAPNSAAAKIVKLGDLTDISIKNLSLNQKKEVIVANVDIINNEDDYIAIEYRFQWRDKDGMMVGTEENWKTLQFSPMQTQRIEGIATSKSAVDFKLELKNKN